MNTTSSRFLRPAILGLLSLVVLGGLAGCSVLPTPQADTTRYFVLTGSMGDEVRPPKREGALVLGLKRVEITSYLSGKDMVVRQGGNEITYNNFARWAEPLTSSIGRTLASGFARSENVSRVYPQPFPFDVERDYDVGIRVLRCEGERTTDGSTVASFSAMVEVTEAKPGGAVVLRKYFAAPETEWNGRDYSRLAEALSAAVIELTRNVVNELPEK